MVKKEVVKKIVYDELVKKVNTIQTTDSSDLVKQADYNTKTYKLKKISDHDEFIATQELKKLREQNLSKD